MAESTRKGVRVRLFLIALGTIVIVAVSHPSVGAGATYSPLTPGTLTDVPASEPLSEPPVAEPPLAEPVAEPPPAEPPVAEPLPAEPPILAEPPVAEPPAALPTAEPPPVAPPTAEAPPLEIPTTEPPFLETPAAEPVDIGEIPLPVTEGLEDPTIGAAVATPPITLEATVMEDPQLTPVAEVGQSVVIQTSTDRESLRPITSELRAVFLADASSSLARLADVSSVGTTTRTASGRSASGPVERPASEVRWPLHVPPPSEAPAPSRVAVTFSGQAPGGSSFWTDLALALTAAALAFSLMARVARPVSSRFHEAALVARTPQPG